MASIKDAIRSITGNDVPTAEQRAIGARTALIAAQAAVVAAREALASADDAGEPGAIQKAEAAVIAADREADRAARGLVVAEGKLTKAQHEQASEAGVAGRKALAALVVARERAGAQIAEALGQLEAGVRALGEIDNQLMTVSPAIRGPDFVVGYNSGEPFRRHLEGELSQRAITGQPSSVAPPGVQAWIEVGNALLRNQV